MKQFNLSEWLKNKSRKVITREGKDVEIIHTNSPVPHHPIVGFIDKSIYTWTIDGKLIYGKEEQDKNDLFFAEEEKKPQSAEIQFWSVELAEKFEIGLLNFAEEWEDAEIDSKILNSLLKKHSEILLDLARKEIEKDAVEFAKSYMEDVNPSFEKVQESEELWKWKISCLNGVNKAYTNGKQDALKDLPKWKKITEAKHNYLSYGYLSNNEYYLSIQELKDKLPKEE